MGFQDCLKQAQILENATRLAQEMIDKPNPSKIEELIKAVEATKPSLFENERIRIEDAIFELHGEKPDLIAVANRIQREVIIPLWTTSLRCGVIVKKE